MVFSLNSAKFFYFFWVIAQFCTRISRERSMLATCSLNHWKGNEIVATQIPIFKRVIEVFHEVFAFKYTRSNSGNLQTKISKFRLASASTNIAIVLSNIPQVRTSRTLKRCFFFCQWIRSVFKWFCVIPKHILNIYDLNVGNLSHF